MNAAVRFIRRRWYLVIAALLIAGFIAWLVQGSLASAHDRKVSRDRSARELAQLTQTVENTKQTVENSNQTLQILLSLTGPEAQARSAAATIDILQRNAVETDCRSRRQQARLPAPDPTKPCVDQTPADVFPGIAGQPARSSP